MRVKGLIFWMLISFQFESYGCTTTNMANTACETDAVEIHSQPLAPILPAVKGNKKLTNEVVLSYPLDLDSLQVVWLDNKNIIYSAPPTKADEERVIDIINIETGKKQFSNRGDNPKVSPDMQWIAFARGKGKDRQLWIMDRNGENIQQLSHVALGLFPSSFYVDYAWSPDSKQIVFLFKENFNDEIPDAVSPPTKIELIDVATSKSHSLGSFDARIRGLSWIPNGREVVLLEEHVDFKNDNLYESFLALNVDTAKTRVFLKFKGLQQSLIPKVSPDGKLIAFSYDPDSPTFDVIQSIGLIENNGEFIDSVTDSRIMRLTHDIKLGSIRWSSHQDKIYAVRVYGPYRQIYSVEVKTGKIKQVTAGASSVESFSISPDGNRIVLINSDAHGRRTLRVTSSDGQEENELLTISSPPENTSLSEVREIAWRSPDYPVPMRGLLLMPVNYKPGERYPLVIDVHGGGIGAFIFLEIGGGLLMTGPLEWQIWTGRQYAVFVPEFRSSGSFGSLAVKRDWMQKHEERLADLRDIDAGVDYLVSQGIVDESRLAVIGHSAGGRRVNLLATTSHRYRSIVSHDGWADDFSLFIHKPSASQDKIMGGSPLEVPEHYLKESAITYICGASTPILFLMGNPKLGGVDPGGTVSVLNYMLKKQGVETQYIYYPDEGHVFSKKENRKDSLERAIEWIDRHFK